MTTGPLRPAVVLAILLLAGCSRGTNPWSDESLDGLALRARLGQLVVPVLPAATDGGSDGLARLGVGGVILPPAAGAAISATVDRLQRRSALPLLVLAELDAGARALDPRGSELPPPAMLAAAPANASLDLLAAEAAAFGINTAILRAPSRTLHRPDAAPLLPAEAAGFAPAVRGLDARGALVAVRVEGATIGSEHAVGGAIVVVGIPDPSVLAGTLRRDLGFDGVVIAELAPESAAVREHGEAGAAVLAIAAGADLVMGLRDPAAAIDSLAVAVESGRISPGRVRASVRRVFAAKDALGLRTPREGEAPPALEQGERAARTSSGAHRAAMRIVGAPAEAVLRGCPRVILVTAPGAPLDPLRAALGYGRGAPDAMEIDTIPLRGPLPREAVDAGDAACVIAASHPAARLAWTDHPGDPDAGRPRRLVWIELRPDSASTPPPAGTLVVAHGIGPEAQAAAAAAVRDAEGAFAVATGAVWPPARTVAALPPDSGGMRGDSLAAIDRHVRAALAEGAFDAAVVAVGRRGALVKLTGYGALDGAPVDPGATVFDIASLTKVVATTTAAMLATEEGSLDLDAPLRRVLDDWGGGAGSAATPRQLLAHTSGLPAGAWLFGRGGGPEGALSRVKRSALIAEPGAAALYSDFGMILLAAAIERSTGAPLDAFLGRRVFEPLGMSRTGFLPDPSRADSIVATLGPAERPYPLRGVVHDGNAFRLGGVAGHAGLFSSAGDLAVFAQAMLNGGAYGSVRMLRPGTIAAFTRRVPGADTRALGWDTPGPVSSAGSYLSARSYGHTGYTGTSLWIDPERELFVILLTNRTRTRGSTGALLNLRARVADLAALSIADEEIRARPGSVVARREAARRPVRRR